MPSRLIKKIKAKSQTANHNQLSVNISPTKEVNKFDKIFKDKKQESGLENVNVVEGYDYHVSVVLVDVDMIRYDYFKLQLLESSDNNHTKYWVIGWLSPSNTNAVKREFDSLDKARNYFFKVYEDKSLSSIDCDKFVKYPRKYYKLNNDLNEKFSNSNATEDSLLSQPTENLMRLIFNIDFAKKTIEELNVDTEKISLEQFSLKQIIDAMMVIEEIWHRINRGEANGQFVDLTNSYYTLIPYKQRAPIISTYDQVTAEVRNLKGLYAIVQSYNLLREEILNKTPIIFRYYRLQTEIIPISQSDYEFSFLEQYAEVTNLQANHDYELKIEEIFKISRKGEDERFEPFKNFHNRYLLWHGSFTINFASIFRHGLKIAPPEVPRLGKKFGKGIYFADMISKSTKFCVTGNEKRTGLMLLCEVAMGDTDECTETISNSDAVSLYELPNNKHSVKRIGKTYPHPEGHVTLDDGVIIPNGRPVVTDNNELCLNYNEYVVYNEAQVRLRYLFKLNFIPIIREIA